MQNEPNPWVEPRELQEAVDAASVRWGQMSPGPTLGPDLFLVSPDISVWSRWLARWAKDRMFILTLVGTAGTIAAVVLALLALVL